jgi:hypothetical protein
MNENSNTVGAKAKAGNKVHAPKGCVASFIRKRDNHRIFVFPRNGESREKSIERVLRHNGSAGAQIQDVIT